MRVTVFGATGNVGKVVARRLRERGVEVRAVTRDPAKLAGVEGVAVGSPSDAHFVREATRGADAVFWMTPPGYAVEDYPAFQLACGRAIAEAVRVHGIRRVVNLSSFGAQLSEGTGPIVGLHRVEELLDATGASVAHVRPAIYFENYRGSAESIKTAGKIFMPIAGRVRTSFCATKDAGHVAAETLLDPGWSGRQLRAVHGPAELSFDEAAAKIGEALGRTVVHVEVTREQARAALRAKGVQPGFVELVLDLYAAVERGHLVSSEPRTKDSTTPTTIKDYAREVFGAT